MKNKCYHFCTKKFFNELNSKKIIFPDNRESLNTNKYAYDYLFKYKNINNGNGMFFAWQNPSYKGYPIQYCDEDKANYVLLEMNVPINFCIKTNYENWCSFICDLDEANGDLNLADEICKEDYGIKDGLEGSFNSIFNISNIDQIQTLLFHINIDWIKSYKFTKNIII